jgi:replicative DNA helicase
MVEKAFLGSLMKGDYLLKDMGIQPDYLASTRHQDLIRRMLAFIQAGMNVDLFYIHHVT